MSLDCPRLVIAGTGSGVGKTSLALGLARAFSRQGLRVQTFKVGPDFLDPTYLAAASGSTCYNLDGWMTSPEYVRGLLERACGQSSRHAPRAVRPDSSWFPRSAWEPPSSDALRRAERRRASQTARSHAERGNEGEERGNEGETGHCEGGRHAERACYLPADLAIIEGVMGLFDGASPVSLEGSTAQIAQWLDAPVLLVVHAHGAARSLAATVSGFARFEPGVRIAGVIANHSGSARHRASLEQSLAAAGLPPLVGAVPRGALPTLASRHLGLVAADHAGLDPQILEQLADTCCGCLNLKQVLEIAGGAADAPKGQQFTQPRATPWDDDRTQRGSSGQRPNRSPGEPLARWAEIASLPSPFPGRCPGLGELPGLRPEKQVRLGIARDEAFHFYYPDNLESLQQSGAELVPFSPLGDATLPEDLDALYFGGGYPEVHAERLAANEPMLQAVRQFAASGRCVYAECGGLMYLARSLRTLDGRQCPMTGVLPVDTAMCGSLRTLGYVEVTLAADCLWGPAGSICRGHEFHYSEITDDDSAAHSWQPAYSVRRRRDGGESFCAGFAKGQILASYVHLHWASHPEAVHHFLSCCEARS